MTSDRQPADAPSPAAASGLLRVVEMFGPTVQGEGHSAGRAALFLRLHGCNLTCAWCDTAFSWDPARTDPARPQLSMTVASVLDELEGSSKDSSVTRLVITGGEPLLQRAALVNLCTQLKDRGWSIEVETSGTIPPGELADLVDRFNVSPKLAHSGVDERARIRLSVLNQFAANPQSMFKFVAQQPSDLGEIDELLDLMDARVEPYRVFVMAEGVDVVTVLERSRALVDQVVARGWGMTPRWHILLWGDAPAR